MPTGDKTVMRYLALSVVLAGVCGVLGGILSGWALFAQSIQPELMRLQDSVDALSVSGTRPLPIQPPIEIIPVEARPLSPAYPAAFSERRTSTVVTLVRRAVRPVADEPIAPEREFGAAVVVTSDGWLATSDEALTGFRLADIGAVVNGKVLLIERGVRDTSTGVVYLKVAATGLPTPAFVRASDVVPGAPVWVESIPHQLAPEIVLTVRARPSADPVPSNVSGRRFLVSGVEQGRRAGASVWDGAGRLIGLLEVAEAGGWRVIPAGPIGSSLSQVFSGDGQIRRATLGVRSLDLSAISLDVATSSLPSLGAWLKADRKLGLAAVSANGPSSRALLEGDVIERIERDILDGTADLGERLLEYRPGASVGVSGRRKAGVFQAEVTLGSEIVSEQIK